MSKDDDPNLLNMDLTAEDFRSCGWQDIVAAARDQAYYSIGSALSAAANLAAEESRVARSKILRVLGDACTMMLQSGSPNEPFRPYAVFGDRRSAIPDDFTPAHLALFADVAAEIDNDRLRARLADLCWLRLKPRRPELALLAIDAYRNVPLSWEEWIPDGRQCWSRGLSLARMLGAGAGGRLGEMESALVQAFISGATADGFLALQIANVLLEYRLASPEALTIAKKLESLAAGARQQGQFDRARAHFECAQAWYAVASDSLKAAEMAAGIAEAWAEEAVLRGAGTPPAYMLAATYFENAIQSYRLVPRKHRSAFNVDARLEELHAEVSQAGAKALNELSSVRTRGTDIGELVRTARDAVRGKPTQEALKNFVNLFGGVDVEAIRHDALKGMQDYPLQSLFGATIYGPDGRVVAKRPAIGLGQGSGDESELAIRASMVRDYGILVNLVVHGDIIPALQVLLHEHRLTQADFVALARESPVVPKERATLFGKALFAGFDLDFSTALHLLAPQIEHMVRTHLKAIGARTSNIDRDGIENENGLSTLMELPEVETVFDKNLAFELRSLYCDPFGPNLRNQLAHGLLEEADCESIYAIYAWWHALKLVFNTFWIERNPPKPTQDVTGSASLS